MKRGELVNNRVLCVFKQFKTNYKSIEIIMLDVIFTADIHTWFNHEEFSNNIWEMFVESIYV